MVDLMSSYRLWPVAVFLWSLHTREYLDVYMFPQNYMSIKDWVANQQILNIDVSRGVIDILRLVVWTNIWNICVIDNPMSRYNGKKNETWKMILWKIHVCNRNGLVTCDCYYAPMVQWKCITIFYYCLNQLHPECSLKFWRLARHQNAYEE